MSKRFRCTVGNKPCGERCIPNEHICHENQNFAIAHDAQSFLRDGKNVKAVNIFSKVYSDNQGSDNNPNNVGVMDHRIDGVERAKRYQKHIDYLHNLKDKNSQRYTVYDPKGDASIKLEEASRILGMKIPKMPEGQEKQMYLERNVLPLLYTERSWDTSSWLEDHIMNARYEMEYSNLMDRGGYVDRAIKDMQNFRYRDVDLETKNFKHRAELVRKFKNN